MRSPWRVMERTDPSEEVIPVPARIRRRPLSVGTAAAKRRAVSEFEKRGQEATNRGPARVWTSLRVSFWDEGWRGEALPGVAWRGSVSERA